MDQSKSAEKGKRVPDIRHALKQQIIYCTVTCRKKEGLGKKVGSLRGPGCVLRKMELLLQMWNLVT